jgi:hypothetical protein
MNKNTVWLLCAALALAVTVNLAYFFDWHTRTEIHIFAEKSRRAMMRGNRNPGIVFHLDKPYLLTSIEVVAADDARTNKYPHALWHLVAGPKPVPTTAFSYGKTVRSMKPAVSNAVAEPLEGGTKYSLMIEAGRRFKGKITFALPP